MFRRVSHAVYTLFTRRLHAFHTPFTRRLHAIQLQFYSFSTQVLLPFKRLFAALYPPLYGHLDAQRALNLSVFTRSLKTDSQRGLQCDLAALLTQLLRRQNPTPHSLATYGDLTDPEGCTGGQ